MKYLLYNYIAVSIVSLCLQAAGRAETSGGERHDYCRNPIWYLPVYLLPIRMYMKPALCNCLKPIRQVSWNLYPLLLSQKKVLLILTGRYV